MEHIRNALTKARVSLDSDRDTVTVAAQAPVHDVREKSPPPRPAEQPRQAKELRRVHLDQKVLEKNRILSFAMTDPKYVAFNLLRTRVRKIMADNKWKSLAVTSPTPGCGKTMVSLNLALSLARTPGCRTVLVDLDLKKPSVARTLGIKPTGSIGQFLQGRGDVEDCFVQADENLIVGLNSDLLRRSSELIQGPHMAKLMNYVNSLSADIVLFDLPPMGVSDDALSFLPKVDTALLIIAAGQTKVAEVDECEQQISQLDKLLGVVMNKADQSPKEYYYDYY